MSPGIIGRIITRSRLKIVPPAIEGRWASLVEALRLAGVPLKDELDAMVQAGASIEELANLYPRYYSCLHPSLDSLQSTRNAPRDLVSTASWLLDTHRDPWAIIEAMGVRPIEIVAHRLSQSLPHEWPKRLAGLPFPEEFKDCITPRGLVIRGMRPLPDLSWLPSHMKADLTIENCGGELILPNNFTWASTFTIRNVVGLKQLRLGPGACGNLVVQDCPELEQIDTSLVLHRLTLRDCPCLQSLNGITDFNLTSCRIFPQGIFPMGRLRARYCREQCIALEGEQGKSTASNSEHLRKAIGKPSCKIERCPSLNHYNHIIERLRNIQELRGGNCPRLGLVDRRVTTR